MKIRPFDNKNIAEYESLAKLINYACPEERAAASMLKLSDIFRDAKYLCRRFSAEENGEIIGIGIFEHRENAYHPDKYFLQVAVAENKQNRGIGSAIYNRIAEELENLNAQKGYVWVKTEDKSSIEFAEKRGFTKGKLKWNMLLDLTKFDESPFLPALENIYAQGITVKMFSELPDSEDYHRRFYEIYIRSHENINSPVELSLPDFEEFREKIKAGEFENIIVAEDKNNFVGLWQLEPKNSFSVLGAAMQIDESCRNKGLGFGLGVYGILYAKKKFFKEMTVDTDEHNKAVLRMTEKLGFTRLPQQILMEKSF